jgi:hypothetical protein
MSIQPHTSHRVDCTRHEFEFQDGDVHDVLVVTYPLSGLRVAVVTPEGRVVDEDVVADGEDRLEDHELAVRALELVMDDPAERVFRGGTL